MSENEKREKRKKIEQKRAGESGSIEEGKEFGEFSEDEHFAKRTRTEEKHFEPKLNPLNMAPSCSNQYQKRVPWGNVDRSPMNSGGSSNEASPAWAGGGRNCVDYSPSSPVGTAVADLRTGVQDGSNRSRSAEIYQMSKVTEPVKVDSTKFSRNMTKPSRCNGDSTIIKNILGADHQTEATPQVVFLVFDILLLPCYPGPTDLISVT